MENISCRHRFIVKAYLKITIFPDFFQFPECDIKDLMSEWRKVSRVVEDTEVMAVYATRMLMKPILNERMRCPANVVDVAIASKFSI
jgi:hypothetical protein